MSTIHAVFEDGVFRPRDPVPLPEGSEVEFEPRIVSGNGGAGAALRKVYDVLSERFQSGDRDVSARHDEHQP